METLQRTAAAVAPRAQSHTSTGTDSGKQTTVSGTFKDGGFSGSASASAGTSARVGTSSRTYAGLDGVGAEVSAEAVLSVGAQAQGQLTTPIGTIEGRVAVTAELYARANAYARANRGGAGAGVHVEVGARVRAEAEAKAKLLGGLVRGEAQGEAESGAGAAATGKVGIGYDPPTAILNGSAGAFAGAHAGFSAKGGIAGIGYGIQGEAWAGTGIKAQFTAGLDDGKFRFSAGIGAALGIGTFIRIEIEIDFKQIGEALGSVGGEVGKALGALFGDSHKGTGQAVGNLFSEVAGLFGGGSGNGAHALALLKDVARRFAEDERTESGKPSEAGDYVETAPETAVQDPVVSTDTQPAAAFA